MGPEEKNARLEVGLLWHTFGHTNLGIDALARGHANLIRRTAQKVGSQVHFTALGAGENYNADLPADVTIGPGPHFKQLLLGKVNFLRAVRACDIVFDIGEGDSFTDIYGVRRFARQIGTKLIAIAYGKILVLAPQTIGPFEHSICRWVAVAVMRKAAGVFVRDDLSTKFLEHNGVTENIDEFIDVAFALTFTRLDKASDRVRVCLNVSGLLYNEGYTGKNELGMALDYKALNHMLIEELRNRQGVEIHLIAHVHGSGGVDDDAPVMKDLVARYPDLIMAPLFKTSNQAKSYLSGMDFVIAGRMHACIGAFSAGVPVVPVAYSRKFNGLFGTLDYPHYIDGKTETGEAAFAKIMAAFEARDVLAARIEKGLRIAEKRLERYENRLAQLLKEVSTIKHETMSKRLTLSGVAAE